MRNSRGVESTAISKGGSEMFSLRVFVRVALVSVGLIVVGLAAGAPFMTP